jgi:hypothetical protein
MGILGGVDLTSGSISVKLPLTLPAGIVFQLRSYFIKHAVLQGELIHALHESHFAQCDHTGISTKVT